jgi:hypothetical protein
MVPLGDSEMARWCVLNRFCPQPSPSRNKRIPDSLMGYGDLPARLRGRVPKPAADRVARIPNPQRRYRAS